MNIEKLGHVVLMVRDRAVSEAFYHGVLGLPVRARYEPSPATFFGLPDDHHLLAVMQLPEAGEAAPSNAPGMRHLAFRISGGTEQLRDAKREVEAAGGKIQKALDHGITHSLYVVDPDGNVVELYVDISDVWRVDPAAVVVTPKPLKI